MTKDGGHQWTNLYGKPAAEQEQPTEKKPAEPSSDQGKADAPSASDQETEQTAEPPARGAGERRSSRGPGRLLEMLKDRDTNGDGKLQRDELPEMMTRLVDRIDTNGDGALDEEEIRAMSQRFGQRGRRGRPPAGEPNNPAESESQSSPPSQPAQTASARDTSEQQSGKSSADSPKPAIKEDAVSGTWEGQFESENMPAERAKFTIVLRMDAQGKISGSFRSTMSEGDGEGSYNPDTKEVSLSVETERATIDVTGTLTGAEMQGTVDVNSGAFSVPFTAKRTGDAPAASTAGAKHAATPEGKPLTELLPGPRWFSSIETSHFQRGRVYVTCDGHRSNDDQPYLFVSEDYGQSWRSLRANLPDSIGSTRVIREDLKNQNVLYLGTEFSIWISVDRGASWTKLNSNLPTVAVHEIAIHPTAGEIVAATHGRSLWILDVSALRQISAESIAADAYLYSPQPAIKWQSEPQRGSSGTREFTGELPPDGASIYYSLARDAGSVSIRVTDIEGKTIRELEGDPAAGLHCIQWDLRRTPRQSRGAARGGGRGGRSRTSRFRGGGIVEAGKYLITLSVDDTELKQVLEVEDDPDRVSDTP